MWWAYNIFSGLSYVTFTTIREQAVHMLTRSPQIFFTRGSFQKFYTLYILFLKMNLFYKMYLQDLNIISIVLYHSGPTFGQVLYSCQDAFVVDESD